MQHTVAFVADLVDISSAFLKHDYHIIVPPHHRIVQAAEPVAIADTEPLGQARFGVGVGFGFDEFLVGSEVPLDFVDIVEEGLHVQDQGVLEVQLFDFFD
jgi:hypothetical protein